MPLCPCAHHGAHPIVRVASAPRHQDLGGMPARRALSLGFGPLYHSIERRHEPPTEFAEFTELNVPAARRRPTRASDTSPRAPEAFIQWPRPGLWGTLPLSTQLHTTDEEIAPACLAHMGGVISIYIYLDYLKCHHAFAFGLSFVPDPSMLSKELSIDIYISTCIQTDRDRGAACVVASVAFAHVVGIDCIQRVPRWQSAQGSFHLLW